MKIKLFLFSAISIFLVACTTHPTLVEEETQLMVGSEKTSQELTVIESTDRKKKPENGRPSIFGDLLVRLNLSKEHFSIEWHCIFISFSDGYTEQVGGHLLSIYKH
jgi:hypothetical protein